MTTTVSTRSSGTLTPTRQQLDELDALLQRMLELPVNKLDELDQNTVEEELVAAPAEEPPADADMEEQSISLGWSSAPAPDREEEPPVQPTPRPTMPPVSYMVVETASPRPLPPASGFEPRPSPLMPRLVPVTPSQDVEEPQPIAPTMPAPSQEMPVAPPSDMPTPSTDGDGWVPLRSTWKPSAQTWQPLADSWHQAQGALPIPEVMPSPRLDLTPTHSPEPFPPMFEAAREPVVSVPLQPETAPVSTIPVPPPGTEPRLSLTAEDAPAPVPTSLLPLLWFNQGFDACLAPLGAPARWLCGSRGRQVLGFIGLTCLAAAAAIAIGAGMGWTW